MTYILTKHDRGVHRLFGKAYAYFLNARGRLTLLSVDDDWEDWR